MLIVALLALLGVAAAQAPNTLAVYNQGLRTASLNASFTILALPKTNVAKLVGSYDLLDVPTDTSLFPQGFPEDKHPVLVSSGFQNDIRITVANGTLLPIPLQIQSLLSAQIYVPYVDRLKNGKSAFLYSIQNYIGGINGDIAMALVPALVGSLAGTLAVPAVFDPTDAAYGISPSGTHSALVKQNLGLYNFISGPSLQGEAVDLYTNSTPTAKYTPHAFHSLYNQPLILQGALSTQCLRNNLYFNDTRFMTPELRTAQVIFGDRPVIPQALALQVLDGQGAYEAVAQVVGSNPESCEESIQRNDAFASQ